MPDTNVALHHVLSLAQQKHKNTKTTDMWKCNCLTVWHVKMQLSEICTETNLFSIDLTVHMAWEYLQIDESLRGLWFRHM